MKKIIKIVMFLVTAILLFCNVVCFVGCDEKEKVEQVIEVHLYKADETGRDEVKVYIFTKENYTQRYEVEYDGSEYQCEAFARYSNGVKISERVGAIIDYTNEQGFAEKREQVKDKGFYLILFTFFTGDFQADLRIKII